MNKTFNGYTPNVNDLLNIDHCDCRRPGNGGTQTCLPVAQGVAPPAVWYGPSSSATIQDPREDPSLMRRTMQDLLRGSLARLAPEEWRYQGGGHLARFA